MSDPAKMMARLGGRSAPRQALRRFKPRRGRIDKYEMALPRNQHLRQKASLAVRTGDFELAVGIYRELQKLEPKDPTWPERCAGVYRELGKRRDELGCLRAALDLQVQAGQVLAAIATCKHILDIQPDHPATLECLHLLYTEPAMNPGEQVAVLDIDGPDADPAGELESDAPLEELQLIEVIPGAKPVQIGDGEPGGVSEIPLEDSAVTPPPPARTRPAATTRSRRAARKKAPAPKEASIAQEQLAATPLFGSLDPRTLHKLMSRVRVVRLEAGEVLFREGDPANTLYVVVKGAVVPIAEGPERHRLAVLEEGEFFGEIGLVTNQPRNATIEALVETRLLAIDRRVIWSLIRGRAEMSKIVLRFLRQRLVDRHIRTHPFFAAFARTERGAVAKQFRFLEVRDGAAVMEQGKPSEGLFVLLAGRMEIVDAAGVKCEGELSTGDVFGGVPLMQGKPAPRSVVADGKCWVLVLDERRFRHILSANPRLSDELTALASSGTGGGPAL
jgi:CRP-like cAMP-binding protein